MQCLIQKLLCVYLIQWDCAPVTSLDLLTLPLCREFIPHRKSYKLTDMAKDISSRNNDAHDTLCDAQTLQELTYGTCMCKSILRYDAQTVFQPSLLCKKTPKTTLLQT